MIQSFEKLLSEWSKKTENYILQIDKNLTCISFNPSSKKLFSKTAIQQSPMPFTDLLDVDKKTKVAIQKKLKNAQHSGTEFSQRIPTVFQGKKSKIIDWQFTPVPEINDTEMQIVALGTIFKPEKKADFPIELNTFISIFQNFPLMIFAVNHNDEVIFWNEEAVTVTGYRLEEIRKKKDIFEELVSRTEELMSGETRINLAKQRYLNREIETKDGETKHVHWLLLTEEIAITDVKMWAVGYDVTEQFQVDYERQQLEAELFLTHKMESIGALAGGVAHDFNNLLVGILGYASLQQTILPIDGEAFQCSQEIAKSAQRMSKLTRQLMIFSRGGKSEPVPTDIKTVVQNTLAFVSRTIDPNIKVITNLEPSLPLILADQVQLHQVIVNLVSNSAEAIQDHGFIKISTRQQSIIKGENTEKRVILTVEDSGAGMDKPTLKKIFEPFFSTKSRGRGLGMSVVYRIIKIHSGEIFVNSDPGQGTTVSITFPATQASAEPEPVASPVKLASGSASILVVDDEQVTLDIMKFSLERAGYKIFTAIDGRSGMDVLKNHAEIDLIILDVVMPGLYGVPLFRRLKKIKPEVKVLLCSGYDETGPAKDILNLGANGFLHKPFDVALLADVIKKILIEKE